MLSQKKRQRIIDLWNSNLGVPAIAKIMNLWENTIRNILKKEGLYPRPNTQSSYVQQGVPKLISYAYEDQQRQQPSPQQTNELQISNERGARLLLELNKRNLENEQISRELADSKKRETQLTSELEEVKGETQSLKKQLDETNIEKKHLIDAFETEKLGKEQRQKTVNELKDEKIKMIQGYKRELDGEKTKIKEEKDHEILELKKGFLKILEGRNDTLTTTENENTLLKENLERITAERTTYKGEAERLSRKQKGTPFITATVGVAGVLGGTGLGWWLWGRDKNPTFPINCEYRKNIGTPIIPIPEGASIQSDIQHPYSGGTLGTTASGFLGSGSYSYSDGEMYNTKYTAMSNPQADMTYAPISSINSGVDLVINAASTQCSGTYVSSHLENNAFTSHVETPVHIPSPSQMPLNYNFITLQSPLPDDLSEVYPMKHLRDLDGIGFEIYIEKLFVHKRCPVERTPSSHDYGADLIAILDWVPTVIQCKQTSKVGVDTILKTCGAMKHYEKTKGTKRCLVITTGEFTSEAIKEAKILEVELWDGKRLLEEIYKDQFFYVPEDESDYDPNK
jgi:restriction system protein